MWYAFCDSHMPSYHGHFQFYLLRESSSSFIFFFIFEFICEASVRPIQCIFFSFHPSVAFTFWFVFLFFSFHFQAANFHIFCKLMLFSSWDRKSMIEMNGRFCWWRGFRHCVLGALLQNNDQSKYKTMTRENGNKTTTEIFLSIQIEAFDWTEAGWAMSVYK